MPSEEVFFFTSPKHCNRAYVVPYRGWWLFIKFHLEGKLQVIIKIMPKRKDLGFHEKEKIKTIKSTNLA